MFSRASRWLSRQTGAKLTWSQRGEDLIVESILGQLGILQPTYLDIGAYHPTELSNTALFYNKGLSGVCVEADPILFEQFSRARKRDVCLNVGIGAGKAASAPFYIMSTRTLNTFSRATAERIAASEGERIESVIDIPLVPINEIIEKYFRKHPNFLSLDTEEYDLPILESLDFDRHRPEVICVETVEYSREIARQKKIPAIPALLEGKGYFLAADTYINSIFVDLRAWNRDESDRPDKA
jgi:FkbM family methyltransferase